MNTRALYWATKAITEAVIWVGGLGLMFFLVSIGTALPWWLYLPGAIAIFWLVRSSGRDMREALLKLKAEANRDTVFGLNGPARESDLL